MLQELQKGCSGARTATPSLTVLLRVIFGVDVECLLSSVKPQSNRWKGRHVVVAGSVVTTTQINISLCPFLHFPDDKHFVF